MKKISAALATYNEEKNIADCLKSIQGIVDEIIIVDGSSTDKTVEIARSFGAKVFKVANDPMFHKMKQQAFNEASGEWILYLDADERVTAKLGEEIKQVVNISDEEIKLYQTKIKNKDLFVRHQHILEERDGTIGDNSKEYVAFFFPRLNYFLGKYLRFGGVYPDGVIRLFKKDQAFLPCKDVHEQMEVLGKVGWLQNDLLHLSDPTFARYLERNSRYINLIARQLKENHIKKGPGSMMNYFLIKPLGWFFITQIRHKGIFDGLPGIIFSFFSALRFPRAYFRYLRSK